MILNEFDWINVASNAMGAAAGAFIILGIDKIIIWRSSVKKDKKKKRSITNALLEELHANELICNTIIEAVEGGGVCSSADFKNAWITKYIEQVIDYTKNPSIRRYSLLSGMESLASQIIKLQEYQKILLAAGRAYTNFDKYRDESNGSILKLTKELKANIKISILEISMNKHKSIFKKHFLIKALKWAKGHPEGFRLDELQTGAGVIPGENGNEHQRQVIAWSTQGFKESIAEPLFIRTKTKGDEKLHLSPAGHLHLLQHKNNKFVFYTLIIAILALTISVITTILSVCSK